MDFTAQLFIHVYFCCNAYLFGYYKGRGLDRGAVVEEYIAAVAILLFGVFIAGFIIVFDAAKKAALKTNKKSKK